MGGFIRSQIIKAILTSYGVVVWMLKEGNAFIRYVLTVCLLLSLGSFDYTLCGRVFQIAGPKVMAR